ncbi:glycosyltransferase family 4 protein [bacterium]|nr:glycosyltransferase family 4 protein [bacterium]
MQPYKICVDARMIFHSGIGTYLKNILFHLIADKNLELTLMGDVSKLRSIQEFSKVDIIELKTEIYSIKEQLEIPKLMDDKNFDLFFSPHYNAPIFIKTPLITTIHDVFHLSFPTSIFKKIYAYLMFYLTLKCSNQIITISEFTKSEIIKYLKPTNKVIDKICKIANGVAQDWIDYPVLDNPYKKPYILYVGNVKPHKNLKTLIHAFASIKDQIQHDLLIIGKKEGFLTEDKESEKLTKDLSDRIHFTGRLDVSAELFCQYYEHSDLFIFPSLYEGFGLPPLEAMARKTKVILSDIPVLKETFSDCAKFFSVKSKEQLSGLILKSLKDEDSEMIEKAYQLAQNYTWKKTAEQTKQLMIETIESSR